MDARKSKLREEGKMIKDGILGIPPVLVCVTGVSWDLLDCYVVLLLQLREPIEY